MLYVSAHIRVKILLHEYKYFLLFHENPCSEEFRVKYISGALCNLNGIAFDLYVRSPFVNNLLSTNKQH